MTDRLDVLAPKAGRDGRTHYKPVGSAWLAKSGNPGELTIVLDTIPMPVIQNGVIECRLITRPARETQIGKE